MHRVHNALAPPFGGLTLVVKERDQSSILQRAPNTHFVAMNGVLEHCIGTKTSKYKFYSCKTTLPKEKE